MSLPELHTFAFPDAGACSVPGRGSPFGEVGFWVPALPGLPECSLCPSPNLPTRGKQRLAVSAPMLRGVLGLRADHAHPAPRTCTTTAQAPWWDGQQWVAGARPQHISPWQEPWESIIVPHWLYLVSNSGKMLLVFISLT